MIRVYDFNGLDVDCIELIYFKSQKEASEMSKKMNTNLNLIIVKFNKNLYSISLIYKCATYFNK